MGARASDIASRAVRSLSRGGRCKDLYGKQNAFEGSTRAWKVSNVAPARNITLLWHSKQCYSIAAAQRKPISLESVKASITDQYNAGIPSKSTQEEACTHLGSAMGRFGDSFWEVTHQFKPYAHIPLVFIRDHCQCSECIHPDTKQRLVDTHTIPADIKMTKCVDDGSDFRIEWSDGHTSVVSKQWLDFVVFGDKQAENVRDASVSTKLWDASIKSSPPTVDYEEVMASDDGVKQWLLKIREHGFCFVDSCPVDPEATEKLLEKIAFIRVTHYGGFYDFTADLASKDTAYTSIALGAHTDNTYFTDPAGLQAFHLLSHTDGCGGESLLVDGFKAAKLLQEQDPAAYTLLSTVPIHAHASGNDGISIQPSQPLPVLNHHATTGELMQVRWNPSDRSRICMPIAETSKWYDAARKWEALLRSTEMEYWEQLRPGRPVVFDNWRVLHGRAAFSGKRRMCGAYISRDDWVGRFRILNWGQDEVLKRVYN